MTKLLKKSLAVVISVALCLSVMVCGFVTSAEGNPTITAKVAETAIAGENVEISIYAEGFAAAAIAGAEFTVELGDLAYVALADGAVTGIDAYTNVVDNTVKFVSENIDEQVTADGALFTITAALPAEAEDGAEFTVSIVDGIFCTAADGEPEVEVDAVDGVVTIATPVVDPSVAINVSPAEGYIGDEIAIEVVAANFDKVAGAQFVVDLAGLEYVSVASDAIEDIEEYINAVDGGVKFVNEKVADGLVDIEAAEGVLFTITAKITDAAESFEIAIVDSKFCEGGEGEPVIENVILAGATVASLGNKGPKEDPNLAGAFFSRNLQIGSTVGIYYTLYFSADVAAAIDYEYDAVALSIDKEELDGNYVKTGNAVTTLIDSNSEYYDGKYASVGMYYFTYLGVGLYEMKSDITTTLYLYNDGEVVAYYTCDPVTLTDVAMEYYATADTDTKKAIIVDFLNMGTEAQKYFATQGEDLENNALVGLEAPNANVDQAYATDYELADATYTADSTISANLMLRSAPSFYYTFYEGSCTTPANMTFTATYTSGATVDPADAASAKIVNTRTINGADMGTGAGEEGAFGYVGMYYFAFDQVALYDSNKEVTYTVTDGTNTWTYVRSLDSFLAEQLVNTESATYAVYDAVAAFGASARNFWPQYVD